MYRTDLFYRNKNNIANLMPYGMIINGDTIHDGERKKKQAALVVNKNGSIQTTWKYRGPDLESSIPEQLAIITAQLNSAFQLLGTGWVLYFEAQRSPSTSYAKDVYFPDPVTKAIDEERRKMFSSGTFFESDYYMTLCWLPPSDNEGKLKDIIIEGREKKEIQAEDHLEFFGEMAHQIYRIFQDLGIPTEFLDKHETATYLHSIVSSQDYSIHVPEEPTLLDHYLYDDDLLGGNDPMLGKKYMKVVVPLTYPNDSMFGMLNDLNRENFSYRWITRYYCLDKKDSLDELSARMRGWNSKVYSAITMIRNLAMNREESPQDANKNALMKVAEVERAKTAVEADELRYGFYSTMVIVMDEDYEKVCSAAKAVKDVFQSRDMRPQIEDMNSVDAWLGSIPGNLHHYCRRPPVSTGNLVHMMPISDIWAGPQRNKHLKAPALLYTRAEGSTPFRLDLHVGDVGHTLVVGPTGAGKSVLLNMISAQFRKYKDARIFIFDKGASSRVLTEAVGGKFFDLANDKSGMSFQPLVDIDNQRERSWVLDWLCDYIAEQNMQITPEVKRFIREALESLATQPKEYRLMQTLVSTIQNKPIKEALKSLTLEGEYGQIFDARSDDLEFSSWQAFEMEKLMDSKRIVGPTLMYIFHRIQNELERNPDRPSIIVLDEGWIYFDNPQFAAKIREWLKVLRKANTSVIFATQSLTDIVSSPIFSTVLESCHSRIFLPNKDALEKSIKSMYRSFGLNERQIILLSKAIPKKQYYYTSPMGSRMFETVLGKLELAFVGVNTADVKECKRLVAEYGQKDFVRQWLKYKGLPEDSIPDLASQTEESA